MQAALKIPSWMVSILWRIKQSHSTDRPTDLEARLLQLRQEYDSDKKQELKDAMIKQLARCQKRYPTAVITAYYKDVLDAYNGSPDQHYRSKVNYPTD